MLFDLMIALRGRVGGRVGFTRTSGGFKAELSLAGSKKAAAAFFIEKESGRVLSALLDGAGRAELDSGPVCAAAAFDAEGRLLCSGAAGGCGEALASKLDEMRIRAAGLLNTGAPRRAAGARAVVHTAPQGDDSGRISIKSSPNSADTAPPTPHTDPQSEKKPDFASPVSPAARAIIGQARELFAPLKAAPTAADDAGRPPAADDAGAAAPTAADDAGKPHEARELAGEYEAVRNPFPRTYPDSVWKKRPAEETLTGEMRSRGGKIRLIARPAQRGARRARGERFVIDTRGLGWFVREGS